MHLFMSAIVLITFFTGNVFAGDQDKKLCNATGNRPATACSAATVRSFQSNIFQNASGRVSLILLKNDKEPVQVNVYDDQGRMIFNKRIKEDSIKQNFNMMELDPGDYRFTISRNGECFTKTVTVK